METLINNKLFILSNNFKLDYKKLYNKPLPIKIYKEDNIIYSYNSNYQQIVFRLLYLLYNILISIINKYSYKKSLDKYVSIYSIHILSPTKVQLQKDNVIVTPLNDDFIYDLINMINSYCSNFILYELKNIDNNITDNIFNNIINNSKSGQCNITFDESIINLTEYINSLYNINDDTYKMYYNINKCFKLSIAYCYNQITINNVINHLYSKYYKTPNNEFIVNDVINVFNKKLFNTDNVDTILKIFYLFCGIKIQD